MIKISNFQSSIFNKKSFTLVDVLVGTFLILIVFLGIFGAYQLGFKVIGQSKNKITATAILNEEIEKIRNLPYESVGVQGQFPEGVLESISAAVFNNVEYIIERRVDFVVDSADGIAAPDDDCPNDYKKAEIKVSWSGALSGEIKASTDISPKNLAQECGSVGGILSVSVADALGLMVPSPLIEIKDPVTDQTLKTATPNEGKHYFSLSPSAYKVVVSKSGYSTERTYGTTEITTPENPHPLVLEGQLVGTTFFIDKVSSMNIQVRGTKGAGYPVIHNVTFTLTGAKIIGYDSFEKPVYKYSQNHTTNGAAKIEISNLEWDSYSFSVDKATTGLNLVGIEAPPGTEITPPVSLPPDTNQDVRLIVKAENSLLITVQDIETLEPIFSATVRLYNTDLLYDQTQNTDEKGQAYFIPLEVGTYNLEVQAQGYSSLLAQVSVSGDTTKLVELEQVE